MKYKLILASNSPRRRELLSGLGVEFQVRVMQGIDESFPEGLAAEEIPLFISRQKAAAYTLTDTELLITADTVVYLDGHVLGKPVDGAEARRMLQALRGKTHQVVTGVTLRTLDWQDSFATVTQVTFSNLTDAEIDYYIEHYRPFDKAGAYGIQEWIGYVGVTRLEGSYFNVMGLPVQRLYTELKKHNAI